MYKISVILPVYNMEKYLEKCVDTIVNQTIGFENIELIIVDDCSEDKSYEISKKYSEKYPNCIAIKLDKKSGSAGRPRNVGIDRATGKYLMFSDPDDFFELSAFEKMYNEIDSKKADFVIANWNYADEDGTEWEKPVFNKEKYHNFKLNIHDYKDTIYIMNSSMCNKIFDREFIEKHHIRCLEYVPGEDTYFSMCAFLESKNVYYIEDIIYYYRQRNTTNPFSVSWNCSLEYFSGMNVAYKTLYDKFIEKDEMQYYRFVYARNMPYLLYRFIDSTLLTDKERIKILEDTRWFYELSQTLKIPTCQKSLSILIDKIICKKYEEAIEICKIIAEVRSFMPKDIKQKMSRPYSEIYEEILKSGIK